jgi:hypothetical protein
MLLDAFVELIEQGSVHDSQPRALGIRRKVALVEQLLKSIASDERLQSVQITMLADHHLRVIPLALQQRRETQVIMGVPCLHGGGPVPRKRTAQRRKQPPGGLHAVGEEMLEIDAIVLEPIQEGRALHPAIGLSQIPAIQPFEEQQQDIGRLGQSNAV